MKNSQLAVLCAAILIGALIVAAGNWLLVESLQSRLSSRTNSNDASASIISGRNDSSENSAASSRSKPITIAMMPKSKGNAYFIACRKGADEAAKELGVTLLWDGPTDPDPAKQNEVIDFEGVKIDVEMKQPAGIVMVTREGADFPTMIEERVNFKRDLARSIKVPIARSQAAETEIK